MPGFERCMADVLRGDILSVPASTFVTAYPLLFNAASAVPTYLFSSLRDIWLTGTNIPNSRWTSQVTDYLGPGRSGSRTIDVVTTRFVDQVDAPDGYPQSNTYGAEFAEIYVYMKLGGEFTAADTDRISNAELRIRRLLDYNYRTNVLGQGEIPIGTAITIDANSDRKAYWKGSVAAVPGQAEKDLSTLFCCTYTNIYL